MGGGGTSSPVGISMGPLIPFHELTPEPPDPLEEGYTVINRNSKLGGKRYPFIEECGREWSIVIHPNDETLDIDPAYKLEMEKPTLRWINGDDYIDVYIDGLTREQFEALTGLQFSDEKGGFILSKRVSRTMRDYYLSNKFPSWNMDITYITDERMKKILDGGGVVSRAFLKRMPLPPDLDPTRRAELLYERDHATRVEFTILNKRGQFKGHAIVSDVIEEDFIIPDDNKGEVRLTGDDTWVGFDFVHGHTDMRIDIQSLVNLYPFLNGKDYHRWLRDEYNLFEKMVHEGKLLEAVHHIQPDLKLSDLEGWPLAQYAVAGGQVEWSKTHTEALFNQMVQRVITREEKLRIPMPGGRMYVMTEAAAKLAGLDITVPRGKTVIDPKNQTVWVNNEDWLSLSRKSDKDGIRNILGGADHDDGIWCFPFQDKANNGRLRVLLWRSPNQAGEYVLLEPGKGCRPLTWKTTDGLVSYPEADSTRLPMRVDRQRVEYLNLVDPDSGSAGKGLGFEGAIEAAAEVARANKGVLGQYCNFLMVCKAAGIPIRKLPARLEDVIDSTVKTGADLSRVKKWLNNACSTIKHQEVPLPELIHDRFGIEPNDRYPKTQDNFLDVISRQLDNYVTTLKQLSQETSAQVRPPACVIRMAFDNPDVFKKAREFNSRYSIVLDKETKERETAARHRALQAAQKRSGQEKPPQRLLDQFTERYLKVAKSEAYDAAASSAMSFLKQYPKEEHANILSASWVSVHTPSKKSPSRSEGAVWIGGPERTRGPAHILIEGLQERGVLAKFRQTNEGRLETYDAPDLSSPDFRKLEPIAIDGVWFEEANSRQITAGHTPYSEMIDVPKNLSRDIKAKIGQLANSEFRGMTLTIRAEQNSKGIVQKVAYKEDGRRFGVINQQYADKIGDTLTLAYTRETDGNLYGFTEQQSQPSGQED